MRVHLFNLVFVKSDVLAGKHVLLKKDKSLFDVVKNYLLLGA